MMARCASQTRAAAVLAGGRAAAARNLPRQHRGIDRRTITPRRSRKPGLPSPTMRDFGKKLQAVDAGRDDGGLAGRLCLARRQGQDRHALCASGRGRAGRRRHACRRAGEARRRRAARPKLIVDASDSARGFFEKRGYVAQQRNTVSVGDEWLANTTMHKQLAAKREALMTKPDTPFPRHWLYYIVLKYGVIAAAIALALYVVYLIA